MLCADEALRIAGEPSFYMPRQTGIYAREWSHVQRIDTGVMICYYISGKYIRLASVMVALPFVIVRHEEG